jgi:formate hydrogenlyase subunit 3/multisubunit Na+/H+ antiporter MnhD subunit
MIKTLNILFYLPLFSGLAVYFIKTNKAKSIFLSLVFLAGLVWSIAMETNKLSGLVLIFINLIGLLVCLYSRDYFEVASKRIFYSFLSWLIAFANLVCLSGDFLAFIFSWGVTLGLLYGLLALTSGSSANKAFSIVGFGDFLLILGIGIYVFLTQTTAIPYSASVFLNTPLSWLSFILMLCGAFAKAGCIPFHTWIPTAASNTSIPVMAVLPASLDKLLGIYFLYRVCTQFFILNEFALSLLLLTGSLTIMFAVMLALIQHDLRKLLSFHAISQVGYMVLGFGIGLPIGIAAGMFHMINNVIYKTGLFLTAGSAAQEKKTFELDEMGGLAVYMPFTFGCGLVFALSISGVPPFNGFASKWMIYQGIISGFSSAVNPVLRLAYLIALISAMFGSALTLASFVKFIHAVFLGQDSGLIKDRPKETSWNMLIPLLVLAGLCLVLGVFSKIFLGHFIEPFMVENISYTGSWNSLLSFILIVLVLLIGLLIFPRIINTKLIRKSSAFIGGEYIGPDLNFTATQFYKTVEDVPLVKKVYSLISLKWLDLYNILEKALSYLGSISLFLMNRLLAGISILLEYPAKKIGREK